VQDAGALRPTTDVELVELSIPALPELLSLPRLVAAAVAARCDFDYDELEDIKLAIEELCLAAFEGRGPGRLAIRLALHSEALEVDCVFEPADGAPLGESRRSEVAAQLTEQLLDALADEHGTDETGGVRRTWFRRSRGNRSG
jgi:hypothetical protein